jgi:ribosomal protein S12 methylthiotransferase accessory factor YcaO
VKRPLPIDTNEAIRAVAMSALNTVAMDANASPSARAAAARTMLEAIGVIGRLQDLGRMSENRNAVEMSREELNEKIFNMEQRLPQPKFRKVKTP